MDISIIIPIYNVEEYLTESLESVRRNIEKLQAEVFLIDDGSTDGSTEIAKFYAENCEGFKYYRTENGGPGHARNFAIPMASGKYLYFMDADDILVEGILYKMFCLSERNKTDLTVCNVARLEGNQVTLSGLHNRAFYNLKGNITHITEHPNLIYDTISCNKLILRSLFINHKLSYPEGHNYEDIPVSLALYHHANGVSVVRSTGYLWRIRSRNASQLTRVLDLKALTDKIDILTHVLNYARNTIADPEIIKALQIKILDIDFNLFIDKMYLMEKEEALPYMKLIAEFFEKHTDKSLWDKIPIKKQQTNEYILKGDYEHLVQVVNYKNANYSKAPIVETNSGLRCILPENIFSLKERKIDNEFINTPPSCYVDFVQINGSKISLFGHSCFWRVSMPHGTDQKLKAFLLNEKTGASVALDICPSDCSYLTEEKGMLLNYDDYTYYKYDYDGAGFRVDVDFETLSDNQELLEDNVIIIAYENIIGTGEVLLRSGTKTVREVLKKFFYASRQYTGTIETDRHNIVLIRWSILQEATVQKTSRKYSKDTLIIQKYKAVCNSKSFKIGRALTWLPRKVRDMLLLFNKV